MNTPPTVSVDPMIAAPMEIPADITEAGRLDARAMGRRRMGSSAMTESKAISGDATAMADQADGTAEPESASQMISAVGIAAAARMSEATIVLRFSFIRGCIAVYDGESR
jgi:hypothetical protein